MERLFNMMVTVLVVTLMVKVSAWILENTWKGLSYLYAESRFKFAEWQAQRQIDAG